MSFIPIPVTSTNPAQGFSTPERVSFCVQDSGSGGQLLINGLGVNDPTVAGAVDLKTLFGSAFRSIPLMRAFRQCADVAAANVQFNTYLNFSSTFVNSGGPAGGLATLAIFVDVPFFAVGAPAIAGVWRIDLQLRHSIPG